MRKLQLLGGSIAGISAAALAAAVAAKRPVHRLTADNEVKLATRRASVAVVKESRYSGAKLRELRAERGVGSVRRWLDSKP